MISSLTHMLSCIKGIKRVAQTNNDLPNVTRGLRVKKALFTISLLCTLGLIGFFLEHRYFCHEMGELV